MNDPREPGQPVEPLEQALPKAKLKRSGAFFPVVWVVPLIAAIVAGYLVYDSLSQYGPKITISFKDGGGLRTGQTPIKFRGVPVGEVTDIELAKDQQRVLVTARLRQSAASIARRGATFWIVRPEVGFGNITGLGTVITGPEIQVLPGHGESAREFVGLDSAPIALESEGLKIILRTDRPHSLKPNTAVSYRGVEVGVVQEVELSPDAAATDLHVLIRKRYARLVRNGSMFWNVSGASVSAGLFSGLHIQVDSLRALATGGIEFATPSANAPRVKEGTVFALHEEPSKEWLAWRPQIRIPPESSAAAQSGAPT